MDFILAGLEPPTNVARRVRELQESLYRRWGLISPLALPPLVPLLFFDPGGDELENEGPQAGSAAGAGVPGPAPFGPAPVPDRPPPAPEGRAARRLAEALRRSLRGPSALRAPRLRTAGLAVAGAPAAARPADGQTACGLPAPGPSPAALYWEFAEGAEQAGAGAASAALTELVRARVETGPGWPVLIPPPFPVHAGFFLALQEPGIDLLQIAASIPRPEPLMFTASALSLVRVHPLRLEPLASNAAAGKDSAAGSGLTAAASGPGAGAPSAQGAAEPFEQPPWWRASFWEELLNVPLKKPPRPAPKKAD